MNLLAQDFDNIEVDALPNFKFGISGAQHPARILTAALPWIFGIAGIILLLNIISSGLKMMTSKGDPKVLQGAQAKLTTSAIGILILFVSFWIVQLIMKFIGINTLLFN